MADITMCTNKKCTVKEQCYRFTAERNPFRQSIFKEGVKTNKNKCDDFVDNKTHNTA